MKDIFQAEVLCPECNIKTEKLIELQEGYRLRYFKCPKCSQRIYHPLDIERYNGVLIVTGSCWQGQTEFEEKIGNIPDPCKVLVVNLKNRDVKIFNFKENE